MPEANTVPTGAEGTNAPDTHTERGAAAAIENLIDWEGTGGTDGIIGAGDDTDSEPEEGDDAGSDESPTTGEDEGHSEPQDGEKPAPAAIEPPASWSAEDKALFAKLPPEAQAVVARRESERDKLIQQRTQEIADNRKANEAERTAIEGQRKQYLDSLTTMLHLAVPEAKQFAELDWQALAASNPAEHVRLSAQRDALRERVGRIQAEMQRAGQEADAAQKQRVGEYLQEQRTKLVEKIPEFGDSVKAAALTKDLNGYLSGLGFSADEIGQVADHRLIAVARDAMLYRQAEAARKAAEAKRNNPAPNVQRPNAAPAPEDGQGRRIREQGNRLVRTGSMHDAARLLENIL